MHGSPRGPIAPLRDSPEADQQPRSRLFLLSFEPCTNAMNYNPDLDLKEYAENPYQDVGAVAMTLIQLRYKQAEEVIRMTLGKPSG